MVFNKDNSTLIYLKSQNNNRAYSIIHRNIQTGALIKEVPVTVKRDMVPFAATPDGFKLLAKNAYGIGVIHNGTGKLLRTLPYPSRVRNWRFTPVQSHDGVLLAIPSIGPQTQTIFLIHTGSGKVIRKIAVTKQPKASHLPIIRSIGFNHNRHQLAYVQQDDKRSKLHIYDIYKQKELSAIKLPKPYYNYGKITFSKNGQQLIIDSYGKKGIDLVDLRRQQVKTLPFNFSSFAGFTPDDTALLIVLPFENRLTLHHIKSGQNTDIAIKLRFQKGDYGLGSQQSYDRTRLALPFESVYYKFTDRFLIINAQTGQVIKNLD